ncbi:helix-turn-helix domain-containing protein [Rhodoplanes tepidamans]|uniref:Helix-turn-helix domain-containing protein n=2 Tax=Rhodoplanes TaxID=29407 RepID=A0ABT5JCY0_RHOTP|nr:helix-turn-helix domain-containing protein [Rhodoplanes tepidamans]MDC7787543.1 helix-turn-helix domain-containing protein [Rhodoplanes tepidamans]
MLVRTPADLGAVLRDRRKHLDLDQATVAKRIGVSRQWVIEIERGHPRAELALVLRAIDVLGLRLDAAVGPAADHPPSDGVDIDAIVARARRAKP